MPSAVTPSSRPLLLVVDDEAPVLRVIERMAARVGYDVLTCSSAAQAMQALLARPADVAMIDLRMPHVNGLDLLKQIRAVTPSCEVILMTGHASVDSAVEAIKLGAREYLVKPFDIDRVRGVLTDMRDEVVRRGNLQALESQLARRTEFHGMLGRSPCMREVFSLSRRLAPHAKVVLITGETGTGKELAARAFHELGPRRTRPFVTINCSAIVDGLFESELFGHVRGAFTGAVESKVGMFESANGGTLFLDEVGELPLSVQPKLLRAIENGEVQRVGSLQQKTVDVVLIAATNRDLRAEVAAGRFRGDLLYRLNVVEVALPPLRERREDIPLLIAAFLGEISTRLHKQLVGLTPAAERALLTARWDGNVRELRNVIERACILAEGHTISERELFGVIQPASAIDGPRPVSSFAAAQPPRKAAASDGERDRIIDVLIKCGGNRVAAAKVLGMNRRALYRRLARYRIDAEVPPPAGRRVTS